MKPSCVFGTICLLALRAFSILSSESASSLSLQWTKSTPLPEPRAGYAAGVLDGKFVVAGGNYWEGQKGNWTRKIFSASTHAFDPKSQSWEKLPDAPIPFGYAASAVVGNKLYVLGGRNGKEVNRKTLVLEKSGTCLKTESLRPLLAWLRRSICWVEHHNLNRMTQPAPVARPRPQPTT